ncbi:MAG: enoyl-CoA hydratase/isomerase family protein [Comamonadaceae bacterium]|nr:enoyl-CoA hydratase/isomerase family protein [Comamonadaceae bacterium]
MVDRFRTMPKATIARIEGYCRGGGGELVLACDMRFAAIGKAVLGRPEVGVGIIPGGGGSTRLPRLVGRGRALEIILGCGDIRADVAERYGYVNRALPADEIAYFVTSLAYRIATFPAEAIALAKQAVGMADAGLEDDLVREEAMFHQSAQTDAARRSAWPRASPAACRRPRSGDVASTTSGARLRTVRRRPSSGRCAVTRPGFRERGPDDEIHAHVCRRAG